MLHSSILARLKSIQRLNLAETKGLSDSVISDFLTHDKDLEGAIVSALTAIPEIQQEYPALFPLSERQLITKVQSGFLNFYGPQYGSPYVPAAAQGPWIVSVYGAVIYDTGGYGMIGFGHNASAVLKALSKPQVMANVMTPSFSQNKFVEKLKAKIGFTRGGFPFERVLCVNSGSESMTVALRISDVHAKVMTDPGGRHAGKKIKMLSVKASFHGRTERPARASDSSAKYYNVLASFRGKEDLVTVDANNVAMLKEAFAQAERDGVYIETMMLEPVMGEGSPGLAVSPEFYAAARELTRAHGSFLLIDSIQAGLRAQGCLSIVDYPGFEKLPAPDMESYSKAINAGQFPLSVLALSKEAAANYHEGIYGNTMTGNPRGLDVACAVLDQLDQGFISNLRARGTEFVAELKKLQSEFPNAIEKVQGTGLLVAAFLKDPQFPVCGPDAIEQFMRRAGINVIHGGKNALRFTPHFRITSKEIGLIVDGVRSALLHFSK